MARASKKTPDETIAVPVGGAESPALPAPAENGSAMRRRQASAVTASRDDGEASRHPGAAAPDEVRQLLTFFASGYEYAVSILHVREIAEHRPLTPVPGTPRWIGGVMNLRGTVVPVIDLAAKLGMSPTPITRRTCLLIVEVVINGEPMVLAVMVDGVSRVVDVSAADLQGVPSFGPRVDTAFLLGMARLDSRLVLLLDINRIVESEDVLAAAAAISAIDEQAAGA